ncbi:hypothetical protein [Archangium sp.]|uniref:hypothetical protein n=1 Tax=Archangium sp. TaxID=1872627 RepID=UPI00286B9319|nr:hypothetical protein [Archangium sp.]
MVIKSKTVGANVVNGKIKSFKKTGDFVQVEVEQPDGRVANVQLQLKPGADIDALLKVGADFRAEPQMPLPPSPSRVRVQGKLVSSTPVAGSDRYEIVIDANDGRRLNLRVFGAWHHNPSSLIPGAEVMIEVGEDQLAQA